MTEWFPRRPNLLNAQKDNWNPPRYPWSDHFLPRTKGAVYRFMDLQAGTIWDDLSMILPNIKGNVVDAGCGLQPFRHMFSQDIRYIGLDSVDSKSHFGYEAPDTLYYSGDIWPLADQSTDFILCTETLEHVPEPSLFLNEAFRVLRPGGTLLLTIPFSARWHFIPYDYWRFTPSGLNQILKRPGFHPIQVFSRGNSLTVACYKFMAFLFGLWVPGEAPIIFRLGSRLLGIICLPALILGALVGNLSKGQSGSEDCLGYTVLAERPGPQ